MKKLIFIPILAALALAASPVSASPRIEVFPSITIEFGQRLRNQHECQNSARCGCDRCDIRYSHHENHRRFNPNWQSWHERRGNCETTKIVRRWVPGHYRTVESPCGRIDRRWVPGRWVVREISSSGRCPPPRSVCRR
ncbi:MAG: hypothetical protein ACFB21_16660 [Opitutales bacterium]